MARLSIRTRIKSVVVCGAFCNWDIDKAIYAERKHNQKCINIDNMPTGEYRVFSCKSFLGGEIYPNDGRQMQNRYFSGEINEIITCYF